MQQRITPAISSTQYIYSGKIEKHKNEKFSCVTVGVEIH